MISSTSNRNDYAGSSSTAAYAYTYPINSIADLVFLETTAGVTTTKLLTTDYTVVENQDTSTGGIVTRVAGNLPTGTDLSIQRIVALTQAVDFANQATFFPASYETAIDTLTMMVQQLQDQVNRCIQYPQAEVTGTADAVLPPIDDRADEAVEFDSDGNVVTV